MNQETNYPSFPFTCQWTLNFHVLLMTVVSRQLTLAVFTFPSAGPSAALSYVYGTRSAERSWVAREPQGDLPAITRTLDTHLRGSS